MACLGSVLYDPGTLATASTSSLLAMTALDTTNARITFTAPANGNVLVRIRVPGKGATSMAMVLLGVLDGATVRGRQSPIMNTRNTALATNLNQHESAFLVTGLTPGNSYTWDAAYGVESVVASSLLGWGGPNDTTGSNAYGALSYEVWSTENLLAGTMYDPGTAATAASLASATALTALDTTNLRLSFTVPASGRVLVRERCVGFGSTSPLPSIHLGVLQAASVLGRQVAYGISGGGLATDHWIFQSEFVVGGLTPAANLTWDAAYAVETGLTSSQLAWGGPNDTTATNAYGGFAYEIWSA